MKKNLLIMFCFMTALNLQAQTVYKVDFNEPSRNNMDEVLEPGFTPWKYPKDVYEDVLVVDDATFTVRSEHIVRVGWNKTFVQKKEQNCRLTGDGVNLEPDECGSFSLIIKGLSAGQHTIQTVHNAWADATVYAFWPITISLNGTVVHENVARTGFVGSLADATVLTTTFTVSGPDEEVTLTFSTSEDNPPADAGEKSKYNKTPLLNGFLIDAVNTSSQAKRPNPADADMHVDADNGSYRMTWSAANDQVARHLFYFGTDSVAVAEATTPTYEGTDTAYTAENLRNLDTYYWRVDEVDADGTVTRGEPWSFRPRQLAFPEAEGYGRYANGGRGGVVYHVTNLNNDHNPGSLLYGLVDMTGPRTIVFDVSGIIVMNFGSQFVNPNVTIAGQTAPGKGICLKASNINIGSDVICRFIRFKRGLGVYGENTGNAMGMSGADHAIVDHCTAAWGTDETVSGRGGKNLSFQYSVISEALGIAGHKNYADGTNHGFAATIDGKVGSWHHNLLVNCNGRNWSMGGGMDGENRAIGQMDLFNNVCYNWWGRTTDGGCHEVNFVNNYYKMGPDTKRTLLFTQQYENIGHIESKWQAYIAGNIRENKDHSLTNDAKNVTYNYTLSNGAVDPNTRTDQYQYNTFVDEAFFPSYAVIHSAKDALKIVTSYSGVTMPVRDEHHVRNVRETLQGTYTYVGSKSKLKGEIDTEEDITEHAEGKGWETYPEETRASDWDTDQDGMPDWWEKVVGSDPNTANHNDDPDHDGWTLLEDYLEFMAHPYVMIQPAANGSIDLKPHFIGFYGQNGNSVTPTYSIEENKGSDDITATIDGDLLNIQSKASDKQGIYQVKVTVNDGETTYTQVFGVAVTTDATTAIPSVWSEDEIEVAKREFFTLDGRAVGQMKSHEVYLMKITDIKGKVHTVKILKN